MPSTSPTMNHHIDGAKAKEIFDKLFTPGIFK